MEKLITLVKEKTGITAEQATTAVETVLKFLKDKLPGPLGGQIDNALTTDESGGNTVSKAIGGLFGK
jgi:uncharacterized protein (DUF2267 family)